MRGEIKYYYFSLIVIFLTVPHLTRAQINLSIYPEKFDLELSPGEILRDKIRISNLSNISLPIKIKIMNFSASGEKGEISFEESNEDISFNPSRWIKFIENNFVLEPNESKKLDFIIEIPQTVEPGGYYAVAFFQTEFLSEQKEENLTKIVPVIGALFLIKIKNGEEKYLPLEKQFQLVEIKAPNFVEFGPIKIDLRIKNNDPVHIKVGGKLIIYNLFGKIKEEIKIGEQTILPQKIRLFEITSSQKFSDKIFLGPYRAEIILSSRTWREKIGHDRQLVKNIKFYGFPWKIFLAIVLLIIIIFLMIKNFRRNK